MVWEYKYDIVHCTKTENPSKIKFTSLDVNCKAHIVIRFRENVLIV